MPDTVSALPGWMIQHHAVIASFSSLAMLMIWAIYLHLLLQSHRRQRKPMLVITRGKAQDLTAHCMLTNMSAEAVYVQSVVVDLWCGDDRRTAYITEAEDIRSAGNPTGWQTMTRQGPLGSGKMIDLGTFDCILDYLAKSSDAGESFVGSRLAGNATACDISILGLYGSEDLLIGATRRFAFEGEDKTMTLRPMEVETHQIASHRERRRLSRRLADEL